MATLIKQIQLLKGLIHGEVAYTGPFYINVDVTRRCNMRCLGCPRHSSKMRQPLPGDHSVNDIRFELVEKLCKELPSLGISRVCLVGEGEPLLHPHLFDIITAFKNASCKAELFTNGTLINETNAPLILDSGLDVLRVSLWANSPEEYAKLYPGIDPKNMQRTLSGVKIVTDLKAERKMALPDVILTEPLNRYNYKSIDARINLACKTGCDGVAFDTYRTYKHLQGEFLSVTLSAKEIKILCEDLTLAKKALKVLSLNHNVDDILLEYHLGEMAWHKFPCYIGWFFTRVQVDGTIVPCHTCSMSLGNLNESSLEEIWNGPKYQAFRSKALTAKGLMSLSQQCDCNWCCYVKDNFHVHRFFKWVAPFFSLRNRRMSNNVV